MKQNEQLLFDLTASINSIHSVVYAQAFVILGLALAMGLLAYRFAGNSFSVSVPKNRDDSKRDHKAVNAQTFERICVEKEQIESSNRLITSINEALSNLISIKKRYHGKLSDHPDQRVREVPYMISINKPIKDKVSELLFLSSAKSHDKEGDNKWNHLPNINVLIHDYNTLLNLWDLRNTYFQMFFEQFEQAKSAQDILQSNEALEYKHLIDITELLISYTDEMIVTLNDFLIEFPKIANEFIDEKTIIEFGNILNMNDFKNNHFDLMMKKSPDVNFDVLGDILELPEDELKHKLN